MNCNQAARIAFQRGDFLEADRVLQLETRLSDADAVLSMEVLHFLGKWDESAKAATRLSDSSRLTNGLLSRCISILADQRW